MYKDTHEGYVIRQPDTKIPRDDRAPGYTDYLAWLAQGNTPEPADPLPAPQTVTALQGMRAIQAAGLVPAFLAWKAALDPVTDFETLAFLEKAQNWVYDDPVLNAALAHLGISGQKDALFTLASTL